MSGRDSQAPSSNAPRSEIHELASEAERRTFFSAAPDDLRIEVVHLLCDDLNRFVRTDLETARRLVDTIGWMAEALDDNLARGRHLRACGNLAFSRRDYRGAVELYRKARRLLRSTGDRRETLRTLSSGLIALSQLGEFDRATHWAAAAKKLCRKIDDPLLEARLEFNLGHIDAQRDEWRRALARYRQALEAFRRVGRSTDVGAALRNIAVAHQQLHDFDRAQESYDAALEYCLEHGLTRLALEVEYNAAYIHFLRGRYSEAISRIERVRERCVAEGDRHHMALCDLDLAEIYLELNLNREAAHLAARAVAEFSRLAMRYEHAKARTLEAIGAQRLGRLESSLDRLGMARQLFEDLGNRFWVAGVDLLRARAHGRLGDASGAAELVASAVREFRSLELPAWIARCEIELGRLCLAREALAEAREYCLSARRRVADLGMPAIESEVATVLAQIVEDSGDTAGALEAFRQAETLLDELRGELRADELKVSFSGDQQAVHESLFTLYLATEGEEGGSERAFDQVQSAKSRSLSELIGSRVAQIEPVRRDQAPLAQAIRTLREEVRWYERLIDEEESHGSDRSDLRLEELSKNARDRERSLLGQLRRLQFADPDLSELQGVVRPDLAAIRASLPEDAQLVEYFIARDVIYACVLDHDSLEIEAIAESEGLLHLERQYELQLGRMAMGREIVERMGGPTTGVVDTILRRFYDALVGPLADRLHRPRLIVAPHGFLHRLPFHAFGDADGQLVDRFSISYAPSATVFDLCSRRLAEPGTGALILGVPDLRAPLIEDEVRLLASLVPDAELHLGDQATVEVLGERGRNCRLLHVASHGLFRRDNPMFSAIRLGSGSNLSLYDLYDLRLRADLVVLSGCSTGLSEVRGADELIGLTRGLLYAGARSVLVSLWDIDDRSTFDFMPRFYGHLLSGARPAEAVQSAQREIRELHPHPYYWAPFVLVGQP